MVMFIAHTPGALVPKKAKRRAAKKTTKRTVAKKAKSSSASSGKKQFLDSFAKEHATTLKVLRAFPPEQGDFRPHPRSKNARELAWTLVGEQGLLTRAITDQLDLSRMGAPPKAPEDFRAIVDQFEKDTAAVADLIKRSSESQLNGTVKFFTGPGKIADWGKMQIAWFMLSDQIHHRGQMTVYLRMVGGKVPSIYGPSGDEPWT
jgi:uncharacterized damage-inducible protein DinB